MQQEMGPPPARPGVLGSAAPQDAEVCGAAPPGDICTTDTPSTTRRPERAGEQGVSGSARSKNLEALEVQIPAALWVEVV